MRDVQRSSGFVLLLVLVVLVIASVIMTAAARRSCQLALEAGRAQRELQVRWGSHSCQTVFLPRADDILRRSEAENEGLCASTSRSVTLGGVEFVVLLSDEQAKAEANTLARHKNRQGLTTSLRRLQAGQRRALPVRLRPRKTLVMIRAEQQAVYASLDQLFEFDHPSELIDQEKKNLSSPASRVTCWSDGRVNFKRAEPIVLREVLDGILTESQIHELVRFRSEVPDCTLGEVLKHLELSRAQLVRAKKLLTDTSWCHSVWVIARGRTRNWYSLYVARQSETSQDTLRWKFEW